MRSRSLLVLLLGLGLAPHRPAAAAAAAAVGLTFSPPALIDRAMWPQGFVGLAGAGPGAGVVVAGSLGGTVWEQRRGRGDWECAPVGTPALAKTFPSHCAPADTACGRAATTFGRFAPRLGPGQEATAFNASGGTVFSVNASTGRVAAHPAAPRTLSFAGLPKPIVSGRFSKGGLRTGGTASLRAPDGSLLATMIVTFGGQERLKYPGATSIVVFRSTDEGVHWRFLSTLAEAKDFPWSQEGPNEMDLETASDGTTILAVMRFDAGDGPVSHPYVYYRKSVSRDSGRTWSAPEEMVGCGCARPRLLRMGTALVLTGGRMRNENTSDILMWVDATGTGDGPWARTSITFWHNRLVANASLQFDARVNSTTFSPRETNSYTSLVRLDGAGARGLVTYDMYRGGVQRSFSMEFALVPK